MNKGSILTLKWGVGRVGTVGAGQSPAFDSSALLPGDCLLYRPKGFFGWVIAHKTWERIAHVEIYLGYGMSAASRDGLGVNLYAFRRLQLAYVLRPRGRLDLQAASYWLDGVRGQKYDWLGLLSFYVARNQGAQDRMFCSEFAARWYRAAQFQAVSPRVDADRVAPAQFLQSPVFDVLWADGRSD